MISTRRRGAVTRAALVAFTLLVWVAAAPADTITPIAAIQANPSGYTGQIVTVEGSVTIPVNYRGPTFYSAYIQDGSGRGINIFGGSTALPNASALNTVGNVVQVTGEVQPFQTTTIEITNVTAVTLVTSGSPRSPVQLSTQAANDSRWEGTLIEVRGNVDSSATTTGSARNYWINDGTGRIVTRVYNSLGISTIPDGTYVVGRGAGTYFVAGAQYQFYVGQASDLVATSQGPDTQAPTLVGAWAMNPTTLQVTFSELLGTAAGSSGNYEVFETAAPSNTVPVTAVTINGPLVTLSLGSGLAIGGAYTVRASNLADAAGNSTTGPLTGNFPGPVGSLDTTPPTLASAAAPSLTSVRALFSEALEKTTGENVANYSLYQTSNPANTATIASISVSGSTATLTLGAELVGGTGYTLAVQHVTDLAGNALAGTQTAVFTSPGSGTITPISEIQTHLRQYKGQTVTVEGQVYIPSNYRGTTTSGFIQDGSGRGINVFGSGFNLPSLQDIGNIVTVTAVVDTYFTTVELVDPTNVTLASSGNLPLSPTVLTTGQAASAAWEGTFIQVTGPITGTPTVTGGAHNYVVNDGSGAVTVRIMDTLGVPIFNSGDRITARGAGSQFQTTYQVLVGRVVDAFLEGGDTTPPTLTSASASNLTTVRAVFSEAIDPTTGGTAANYSVYPTSNPSGTVPIASVGVSGSTATLTMGSPLTAGTNYTVSAQGVQDLAGNAMASLQTATFDASASGATSIADIQNNLRQFKGQTVTVEGQVYIPSNYRGTTTSGYIQDSSNRGINVFGSGFNIPALQDIGNIVRVTAVVDTYFTTVELVDPTNVTLVSSGNSPLSPAMLTTGQAANHAWEGTFIQVTGTISSSPTVTGGAHNYVVNDGSGAVTVRIMDTLGVPIFASGQTITARGAGSQFQTTYQVLVGRAADAFQAGGDTTPPTLTSASSSGLSTVRAVFSEAIDPTTGGTAANYSVYPTSNPAATVPITSVSVSGSTATLTMGSPLTGGTNYTVSAQGVKDLANNVLAGTQTAAFTASASNVTQIADIQNNLRQYKGQTVTVEGQVYIPSNYRGTTTSGFIQDGSNRGINVFGSGFNVAALHDVSNMVRVTAVVDTYFTTVELVDPTNVTLVSSGHSPLNPTVLTTGQAANHAWEGTYIQVTGPITGAVTITGSGHNYPINDGTGPIVVRVMDNLGAPTFTTGQTITARGAGGQFQADFQVLVGQANAIQEGTPSDVIPPALVKVLATGSQQLSVEFNEEVSQATAEVAANYEVFRTNAPTTIIAVTTAKRTANAKKVDLTLASAIDPGEGWTLRVKNVADTLGNAIPASGTTRVVEAAPAEGVTLNGPKFTFMPRRGEGYPITFTVTSAVASATQGSEAEVLLRIFDLRGALKRTIFDSHFDAGNYVNNRATRIWDGRDDVQQIVPAGTYIVHLLVTQPHGGGRQEKQIPVVVATRLER